MAQRHDVEARAQRLAEEQRARERDERKARRPIGCLSGA
jgi:hypothetical protein